MHFAQTQHFAYIIADFVDVLIPDENFIFDDSK